MYKEVIITIMIVVLIFCVDTLTNRYTVEATRNLSNDLAMIREELKDESNTQEIRAKIDEIFSKWKQYYNVLAYYIEHDELEKVETELTMLKAYEESKKYDECVNTIDTTIFILNHIEDKEKFMLRSIF